MGCCLTNKSRRMNPILIVSIELCDLNWVIDNFHRKALRRFLVSIRIASNDHRRCLHNNTQLNLILGNLAKWQSEWNSIPHTISSLNDLVCCYIFTSNAIANITKRVNVMKTKNILIWKVGKTCKNRMKIMGKKRCLSTVEIQ